MVYCMYMLVLIKKGIYKPLHYFGYKNYLY